MSGVTVRMEKMPSKSVKIKKQFAMSLEFEKITENPAKNEKMARKNVKKLKLKKRENGAETLKIKRFCKFKVKAGNAVVTKKAGK